MSDRQTETDSSQTSAERPTLILLVRHGLTPTTGKVLPGRAPGLHLSEKGLAQAERLAERFQGLAVDSLYTSPLERTRETAEPVEKATGLTAEAQSDLLECDFGEWTGEKLKHLAKLPEWTAVQQSPSSFRFPDGESFTEMQYRMAECIQRLRDRHPGQTVVCFSHADPIKVLLNHALGSHLDHFQRIAVDPCSVSAISYMPGQAPSVLRMNTTDGFLSDLLSD
ncbi:MSMEG_4193 family putative phosphomutase [Kocuria palustris]|uniref:MSMEG_4193 family putative phosphomutase n=1 Tax=Kocuria palustris TaxID=71999 RepID=UPI0021A713C8|nr:MSMEG_4193 family putative phosphomutase [Kocuria palustris]MCT1590872.1 MSMEG_4193 family putative phosphomutase [Kocuria palustris]